MAHLIPVTDFEARELDIYARVSEGQLGNKAHPEDGLFIAESPKVILTALDAGYEPVSALVAIQDVAMQDVTMQDVAMQDVVNKDVDSRNDNQKDSDCCSQNVRNPVERESETERVLLRLGDIPVYTAPFDVLTQLTGFKLTRGMLCAMRRRALPTPEALMASSKRLVVLENVMNPTNLGAIMRSAAALGMDGILLTAGCTDPLYRRAVRVSMGTCFQIPWTFLPESIRAREVVRTDSEGNRKVFMQRLPEGPRICWPAEGMKALKNAGFMTAAMALRKDTTTLDDPRLVHAEKLAMIFGTEGDGLMAETLDLCDVTVKIPMAHGVDSLNVAAASAVAFYALGKQS